MGRAAAAAALAAVTIEPVAPRLRLVGEDEAIERLESEATAREERRAMREHRTGRGWEDGHSCPDCFKFRAPGSATCSCGSYARPVPTHEVQTSQAQKARSARRRSARRRR